ncbi:MAG: exo-alpha-sialidase, partial [Bacteroidales bacterium]|nr:exo-alpha-sialidase [Bacteroidales bacterium]
LFSNPDTVRGRNHITIKASLDDGMTWKEVNQLLLDEDEGWGYSCLSMIDAETVGILYESSVAQITFQAIPLRDIVKELE